MSWVRCMGRHGREGRLLRCCCCSCPGSPAATPVRRGIRGRRGGGTRSAQTKNLGNRHRRSLCSLFAAMHNVAKNQRFVQRREAARRRQMRSSSTAAGRHAAVPGLVLRKRPSGCSPPHGAAALERGWWGLSPSPAPERSIPAGGQGGQVLGVSSTSALCHRAQGRAGRSGVQGPQ